MKSNLKIYDKLPLAYSYKPNLPSQLTKKIVNTHLGSTLYPRLAAIYNNVLQAIAHSNNSYLKNNAAPQLYQQLIKRKDDHKKLGLKLKINEPTKNLLPFKNYIMPQRVYRSDYIYIGVSAKVYFGGQLEQNGCDWPLDCSWLRVGKNRVLLWNSSLSLWQNMKSWYSNQIFEFRVRYQSNIYIKCVDSDNCDAYGRTVAKDDDLEQDIVASEFVLRSSNDKFDWTIVDINGVVESSQKH